MKDHHCPACGWETRAPDHVLVVFHPCRAARERRRLIPVDAELEEDRRAWARAKLGPLAEAFEVALGDDALLPVEEEE